MVYIYVLKCEQNKYYVGKTNNPNVRLESHGTTEGSAWTKKYKPIKVMELIKNCDDYDEDKYTKIYMDRYGIDNVRGGSFVSMKLDDNTINHLTKMSNGTNDRCFKCGKSGHFARDCKIKKEEEEEEVEEFIPANKFLGPRKGLVFKSGSLGLGYYSDNKYQTEHKKIVLSDNEDESEEEFIPANKFLGPRKGLVFKSGSLGLGYYSDNKYQTEHEKIVVSNNEDESEEEVEEIWGCSYCDKEFTSKKGAIFHENVYCKKKYRSQEIAQESNQETDYESYEETDEETDEESDYQDNYKSSKTCYKCGRKGHYANNCYASRHVKGYYLN